MNTAEALKLIRECEEEKKPPVLFFAMHEQKTASRIRTALEKLGYSCTKPVPVETTLGGGTYHLHYLALEVSSVAA